MKQRYVELRSETAEKRPSVASCVDPTVGHAQGGDPAAQVQQEAPS
jgi:hypothetical protein